MKAIGSRKWERKASIMQTVSGLGFGTKKFFLFCTETPWSGGVLLAGSRLRELEGALRAPENDAQEHLKTKPNKGKNAKKAL